MLFDAKYYTYPDGQFAVREFVDFTFFLHPHKMRSYLEGYRRRIGNALDDYHVLYFADEFPVEDEEYFGDHGVAVYWHDPAEDILHITLMEEAEYYRQLAKALQHYSHIFSDDELAFLLTELESLINS